MLKPKCSQNLKERSKAFYWRKKEKYRRLLLFISEQRLQQLLWRVLTPSGLEVAEEKTEALVAADVWQRAEQVEQVAFALVGDHLQDVGQVLSLG